MDAFARDGEGLDDSLRAIAAKADAAPRIEFERAEFDLGLVGGGIVCATAASVISLFIPS